MKFSNMIVATTATCSLLAAVPAHAGYTFTQTAAPAPTYPVGIDLDAAGAPTGTVASNYWTASKGVTIHNGNDASTVQVGDYSGSLPWVTGNAFEGNFGLYLDFAAPVTSFSFQAWDSNGPPGGFGGGFFIALTTGNLGGGSFLDGSGFTGAWGGVGNTWYTVTTTSGSTFQHVAIYNNGFDQFDYINHVSWQPAPAPGAFALLGLAGIVGGKRRRR